MSQGAQNTSLAGEGVYMSAVVFDDPYTLWSDGSTFDSEVGKVDSAKANESVLYCTMKESE